MAPPLGLAKRLLLASGSPSHTLTRSAFIARKPDHTKPNWGMVGLAFGTTVALWVLLFKKHNEDVMEYERRREEREKHDACTGCS
ncbi:NADH dehydrogenase [ubiquinone] 1 subunit C1, mitochondrial [Chelonoidis abingdonii]|uniref:NADH dehydrogenase [ubiquinone] 1 subunit C1, mitochondrial n=1 Tax=Chelonoidis abingdonii TaxID=106734 RepID=A0A8C0IL14_CHEAB|nr:NADH dehydrogenase [ubiquinone] 1 subunit C1, mitochondrial [Chelonoidis abingdonii]